MGLTYPHPPSAAPARVWGLLYAWSGFAVVWAFWICFVVFRIALHLVRHLMYVGFLLAVWATPRMTVGHLLLAAGMTLYVLVAMRYEERDLAARFGHAYASWRAG